MYVISYTSKNGKLLKLKFILTSFLNYRDKKQLRSEGLEHDSMDDHHIKQAMEASGILRDI